MACHILVIIQVNQCTLNKGQKSSVSKPFLVFGAKWYLKLIYSLRSLDHMV